MKKLSTRILPAYVFLLLFSYRVWPQNTAHDYNMSLLNNDHKLNKSGQLDNRQPVKMTVKMSEHQLKNMRGHLEAITAIVGAIVKRDFKKMEKEAARLASSPKMKMMCNNMGKATPGFTEMGLVLHSTADELVHAAKKKDYELFVSKLESTLLTCTSCHSAFKQEIVSQEMFHKSIMKSIK
jgi:hypothetical protein